MLNEARWIGFAAGETGRHSSVRLSNEELNKFKEQVLSGVGDPTRRGSFILRKDLALLKGLEKAVLSIAGLGFYHVYINGTEPDENVALAPLVSDYENRIKYDEYDVTALLREGENCLCAEIGPGWFTGNPKYWGWQQHWYGNPRMIAELSLRYADGKTESVLTDETWKIADGNVTESCVYDGETQDLSRAPKDWDKPGISTSDWRNAAVVEAPGGILTKREAPPVCIERVLAPVAAKKILETETVYDFGENGAAIPRLYVKGRKGDRVVVRHAEFQKPDGTLDTHSENRAMCTDTFILADDSSVVLSPRFTWHGYRYMDLTLSSADIAVEKVESLVIHSDVAPSGSFECGREDLNELHRMYVRTMLACLQGVPVDCPQRDERKGWLGDAYAASEASIYNFDMQSLYRDWLDDLRICRNPDHKYIAFLCPTYGPDSTSIDWNLAYPVILKDCYDRYGDLELLKKHYDTLKDHTEYYISTEKDGMIPPCWFGDWCTPDRPDGQEMVAFKAGGEDHRQNPPFAATLFYAQTLRLAAEIAELTGHKEDAKRFFACRARAKDALMKKYYDPETGRFASGGQFLQTMILAEDLVDGKDRKTAEKALLREIEEHAYHPFVGILGLRRIYEVLCAMGRPDIAYRMLTVEGYPGQLHMLSDGRTTLTELLDFGGSGDHCMFASPDGFLYRHIGGITVDRSRKTPVSIEPYCPADMDYAKCTQRLAEGDVGCAWRRENGTISFTIRVPEGLSAELKLKAGKESYTELLENGGERSVILRCKD
ncbi:MAG: family 78 glycoside hydrolase catalytic domain [Clostridia bacterium]|nr:family 78 glycoside hydrolase catalytic domain [Clostridia bacterium]